MPIQTQTLPILPEGMERAVPQNAIGDAAAWTLIDANLDTAGFLKRRGAVNSVYRQPNVWPVGVFAGVAPDNTDSILALDTDGKVRDAGGTYSVSWPYVPTVGALFNSSDLLLGGTVVGAATGTGKSPTSQGLALYRGATLTDTGAKAFGVSIVKGDTSVTLTSGGSEFCSGHFLFTDQDKLVAVVKSVAGNVLTFESKALIAVDQAARTLKGKVLRGLNPRTSVGRITCDAADATKTVNGGGTKFKAQGLSSSWDLYTPDFTYIGTVSTVTSDAQLVLAAQAAVSLLNSDYIAINTSGSYALDRHAVGWITAQYGGHQFYADGNLIAFSDDDDPEALDLTGNGNTVSFSLAPVRALVAATGGLVSLSEKEAHVLVGGVGTTPDRWRAERIHDDGALCGMAALAYKGGAIWAGKRGVWYWDGADPVNIASKFGDFYRTLVDGVTRAWGAVIRDHYVLYLQDHAPVSYPSHAGELAATDLALVINLHTGSITMWSNVEHRGGVVVPDSLDLDSRVLLAMGDGLDRHLVNGDALFTTQAGQDEIACSEGGSAGPYLSIETKKHSMGDGQRLKLFKQLQIHYFADGVNLKVAMVKGLNSDSVTSTGEFVSNDEFADKRLKPKARSQYCSYQLFESDLQDTVSLDTPATPRAITIGELAIGFKWKRAGRV